MILHSCSSYKEQTSELKSKLRREIEFSQNSKHTTLKKREEKKYDKKNLIIPILLIEKKMNLEKIWKYPQNLSRKKIM